MEILPHARQVLKGLGIHVHFGLSSSEARYHGFFACGSNFGNCPALGVLPQRDCIKQAKEDAALESVVMELTNLFSRGSACPLISLL